MLFFGGFIDERFMDVRYDTATSNGALDEGIKLFISTDSKLEVAWRDPLHFQVFACIARQL